MIAIIQNGQRVDSASQGAEVSVVLDATPFYGEGGGQVGDTGALEAEGVTVDVVDTTKHEGVYLHRAVVSEGTLNLGDVLTARVDESRRQAIMRNHTAAHLLQAALRKVLGDHVEQAGQLVNENHVRFDFTHFSALKPEELAQVELLVNQEILKAVPVSVEEMGIEEHVKAEPWPCSARSTAMWSGWSPWRTASPRSCAAAPIWTTPPGWDCSRWSASPPWPLVCAALRALPAWAFWP